MLHSNATDSMFSEVGTAEQLFKPRSLNGAVCRILKRVVKRRPVNNTNTHSNVGVVEKGKPSCYIDV